MPRKKTTVDNFGRLIQVEERVDDTRWAETNYAYDGNDNLTRIVDAEGKRTLLQHDWLSRRIKISRENDISWLYQYDANGNLTDKTVPHPSGSSALYTSRTLYDAIDRTKIREVTPHGLSDDELAEFAVGATEYNYDQCTNGIGRLCRVDYPRNLGTHAYAYDARGNVVEESIDLLIPNSEIVPGGEKLQIQRTQFAEYSALNQAARFWLPDGVSKSDSLEVTISYDERGLPENIAQVVDSNNLKNIASVSRNLSGRILKRTVEQAGNALTDPTSKWLYDSFGRVVLHEITAPANGIPNIIASQRLAYATMGDVASLVHSAGDKTRRFSYNYDVRHQLTSASDNQSTYDASWSYGIAGRLKNARYDGQGETLVNRDVEYRYSSTRDQEQVDKLTTNGGSAGFLDFEYDERGNVIKRTLASTPENKSWLYQYDGEDQQRSARGPNGREIYFYDHAGTRILSLQKNSSTDAPSKARFWFGGVETAFTASNEVWEVDNSIAWVSLGQPVARIERDGDGARSVEQIYHSTLEHLLLALDEQNEVKAGFIYGPFGEVLDATGNETDEYKRRFNGKDYDDVSELNYYGARYYDSLSLLWTQGDPLYRFVPDIAFDEPRRVNLYSFSLNNPMVYVDPDGRCPAVIRIATPSACPIYDAVAPDATSADVLKVGGIVAIELFRPSESDMAMAGTGVTLAVADGPLPFGDAAAVLMVGTKYMSGFGRRLANGLARAGKVFKVVTKRLPNVKKAIFGPLGPHAVEQGFERGIFKSKKAGKQELKRLISSIKKDGFPKGTMPDTTRPDSVLVPVGNDGLAVFRVKKNGTAELRTTLIRKREME